MFAFNQSFSPTRRILICSRLLFTLCLLLSGVITLATPTEAANPAPALSDAQVLKKAQEHAARQDFAASIILYNVYLVRHPENDEIRGRLAQVLAWNKQYPAALSLYRQLLDRYPQDHELRTASGRILAWTGQHKEAEDAFMRVLKTDPTRADTREALADLYRWSGREAEAATLYRALLREAPTASVETKLAALTLPTMTNTPATLTPRPAALDTPITPLKASLTQTTVMHTSPRAPLAPSEQPGLPYRKFMTVGYAHSVYNKNIPDDQTIFVEGGIPIGDMTLIGRYEQIHRFHFDDPQFSTELYSPLWKGAWGEVHGTVGPGARIIPRWSAGSTVYQSLEPLHASVSFLEPFMGYQYLSFKATDVHMLTPGINIYLPANLWLTESLYLVPETGATSIASQLTWRPVPRVQAFGSAAFGTQGERLTAAQDIIRIPTTTFKAGVEFPVAQHWSAGLVATYENRENFYQRQEGRVYLSYIW